MRFLLVLFAAGGFAMPLPAVTLRITTGCALDEMTITSNCITRSDLTFRYGDLTIQMPKPSGWVENPMLLRPQLLLWRHEPLSMPSTVHVELLGVTTRANAAEHWVTSTPTGGGDGRYTTPVWTPVALCVEAPADSLRSGFARTALNEEGYREEVHFIPGPAGTELKTRLLLSPRLAPEAEAAMRRALAEMKAFSGNRVADATTAFRSGDAARNRLAPPPRHRRD
ncbi:MAG: hypothetical protein IT578_06485 [Verrucomicrobiae bacterium]|nr:hypothetical protein [Verrucomicrobiae bacterium]